MLTRSKRDDLIARSATGPVGPGSYDPVVPSFKPKAGMAPFGSTVDRDHGGALATNDGPGPGAYGFDGEVRGGAVHPSPVFQSRAARMAASSVSQVPGPGSYFKDGNADLIKPPRPHAPVDLHRGEGINWVNVATAPSIPNRIQGSFGYEEGPGGTLVQQPGQVDLLTGVGANSAGPGHYSPKIDLTRRKAVGTDFGRSKGARSAAVPPELVSHPGPGAYQLERCGEGDSFKGGVMNKHASSMFASLSKRAPAVPPGLAAVPGPGSYSGGVSSFESLAHRLASHPETFQVFGSSSGASKMSPTLQHADNAPGPGWYEPPLKSRVVAGHPLPPTAAFASKEGRFGARRSSSQTHSAPGPGAYETHAFTMVRDLSARPKGRFGAFGSTSRRLPPTGNVEMPGPGAYETAKDPANPADLRRRDARSSAFRSTEPRGQALVARGAGQEPGPGEYSPQLVAKKPASMAVNTAPRFAVERSDDKPGPGQYDAAIQTKAGVKPPVSMPKANRFGHPRALAKLENGSPGPGTYNTVPPLLKKSFNMLLLEERLAQPGGVSQR